MLDNVGLRYPHRASGAKASRTLRPLPLLRFAVSATGGAHLCSIQYYLCFCLGICRTSLAVSALRIMRYCPEINLFDIPVKKPIKSSYVREKAGQGTDISVCALSGCCFHEQLALRANFRNYSMGVSKCQWIFVQQKISKEVVRTPQLGQHRTIPALRLKHRSGSCGTASALPKCSIRHPVLSALLAWHLPHLARRIGT